MVADKNCCVNWIESIARFSKRKRASPRLRARSAVSRNDPKPKPPEDEPQFTKTAAIDQHRGLAEAVLEAQMGGHGLEMARWPAEGLGAAQRGS